MALYHRADLLVFPSIYDNAPMVLREAAAMGTPAVVVRGSCSAEGITDGENGFICADDSEIARQAVLRALPQAKAVGLRRRKPFHPVGAHYAGCGGGIPAFNHGAGDAKALNAGGHMKQEIHGNIEGVRRTLLEQMKALYQLEIDGDAFLPPELSQALAVFTTLMNREVAVYITRDGGNRGRDDRYPSGCGTAGLPAAPQQQATELRALHPYASQRLRLPERCGHQRPAGIPL